MVRRGQEMFCGCGRFRFVVRVIYGTVFILNLSFFPRDYLFFFFFSVFTNRSTIQWKSHRLWYWWINEWINNFHSPFSITDGQSLQVYCEKANALIPVPQDPIVSCHQFGFQSSQSCPLPPGNLAFLANSHARWRTKRVNLKDLAKSLERCKKRTVENGLSWFLKKLL